MIRYYLLAAALFGIDQATKMLAVGALRYGRPVEVLPFLSWTLTYNTGAAFSFFQGASGILAGIAACVCVYLVYAIWRLRPRGSALEGASCGLILAGALGNLADRLRHGHVVDFIHVHYGWFNFPVFNVADSVLTIGVAGWIALLLLDIRRDRDRTP